LLAHRQGHADALCKRSGDIRKDVVSGQVFGLKLATDRPPELLRPGDLLSGAIDVYLSSVANRRDQVVKQLTVLATIFLPITFLTGFFGQNFGYMVTDLIGSREAFVVGTLMQVATVAAILGFFKARGWI